MIQHSAKHMAKMHAGRARFVRERLMKIKRIAGVRTDAQARSLFEKFTAHRSNAVKRGVGFHFTFWDWLDVWVASGKLRQRGKASHEYCMARKRDRGDYEAGNVTIITNAENKADAFRNGRHAYRQRGRSVRSEQLGR